MLVSGIWRPGIYIELFHIHLDLQNLLRDIGLLFFTYLSIKFTIPKVREDNGFTWFPMEEVSKLF